MALESRTSNRQGCAAGNRPGGRCDAAESGRSRCHTNVVQPEETGRVRKADLEDAVRIGGGKRKLKVCPADARKVSAVIDHVSLPGNLEPVGRGAVRTIQPQ